MKAHSECSESFYRKEIESDIQASPSTSADERNKMLALLRKFEDEYSEEPDVLAKDSDDLSRKLEAVNLGALSNLLKTVRTYFNIDEADPDVIWAMLSSSQRDSFLKIIRDPSSELAQELLSSAELQQERRKPWWESPLMESDIATTESSEFGVSPKMMSIPQSLIASGAVSDSNRFLVYNILALW
jgi:hypothetical protein